MAVPEGAVVLVPGSSWGAFTIACTIPIALLVGLYMYKIRRGRVLEASLLGAAGVIAATIIGNWIPGSPLEPFFSLSREHTILAITIYGFIASVLPVWLLLCPRDYLSSFLKIGTIVVMVIGIIAANPTMQAPPLNEVFAEGGPTFPGAVFPFVFICIMCGAISGFHSLVSSGTTPKMIDRERDIRPIGYGAMLMEGLVGVVALIAAASLDPVLYFDMNVDQRQAGKYQPQLETLYQQLGIAAASRDPLHQIGVNEPHQLPVVKHDLGQVEQLVGGETLRGRTGGAVTLAVSMALVFSDAFHWTGWGIDNIMKYWYHFVIMFEALFILTTIDTGTRIARFLLQETLGKVHPKFAQQDWVPGAVLSTFLVTAGWGGLIWTGSIETIWPMFGIANQLLSVIALSLVTTWLVSTGRARYMWVTLLPMAFVITTTMTAGAQLVTYRFPAMIEQGIEQGELTRQVSGVLNIVATVFVISCVLTLLLLAASRWLLALRGIRPAQGKA
jgi:carbon starvation protein